MEQGAMSIDVILRETDYDVDMTAKVIGIDKKQVQERKDTIMAYKDKLANLLKIPKIEQKTPEWYEARHTVISASDFAQAVNEGKFGTQRDLIIKKVDPPEYGVMNNPFFIHGNMFEPVANAVYVAMYNVQIYDFGLLKHPHVSFLAASPDGITDDGIMVEIKCPLKRKIGGDVPRQYYYQIQGQLDVCDLDECDYFECEFALCRSNWEFEASRFTKGVIVKIGEGDYVYGPLVLAAESQDTSAVKVFAKGYSTGLLYWVMKAYNIRRVTRDKQFIKEKIPELKEVWDKILFYRENRDAFKKDIMQFIEIETEPVNLPKGKCLFVEPEPAEPELEINIPKFAFRSGV
jgi:putative phage-type endonuclease